MFEHMHRNKYTQYLTTKSLYHQFINEWFHFVKINVILPRLSTTNSEPHSNVPEYTGTLHTSYLLERITQRTGTIQAKVFPSEDTQCRGFPESQSIIYSSKLYGNIPESISRNCTRD